MWFRGGFPRSYLAGSDEDSASWREEFVRTFLERAVPRLGIGLPAAAMRRFWTMLAHDHGQTWNASERARAKGLSDKTVRSNLDVLSATFLVRQLQPWHENVAKRQVKAPKVYFRDTGLLHSLLDLGTLSSLTAHPRVGASWEGFALEQVLSVVRRPQAYFRATHGGAELDLLFFHRGRRYGVEVKFSEAPVASRWLRTALKELALERVWVVHPGVARLCGGRADLHAAAHLSGRSSETTRAFPLRRKGKTAAGRSVTPGRGAAPLPQLPVAAVLAH